jgi:ATP-dependent protease ClpP protease subunit
MALDYYIQQIQSWRQRRIGMTTEALTCAYSAAAIMVSLGDIGHRHAHPTSKLLYHNPRFVTEGGAIDARTLVEMYRELTHFNDSMVDRLAKHVYDNKILQEVDSLVPDRFRWKKILSIRSDLSAVADRDPAGLFVEVDCGDREHLDLEQIRLVYQTLNRHDMIISAEQALHMFLIDSIIGGEL